MEGVFFANSQLLTAIQIQIAAYTPAWRTYSYFFMLIPKLMLGVSLLLASSWAAHGQNIYPEKFAGCQLRQFCLDCGDPKAQYPAELTAYFREKLPAAALRQATGGALVQVLVNSAGQPCALSQTSNLPPRLLQKLDLRTAINGMGRWLPAQEKGHPTASSVSLRLAFGEGSVRVDYQRFDFSKMQNMRSVGKVEILNKQQRYQPPTGVRIEQLTTQNSRLPWDMSRAVCIDQQGTVWAGTDNGLVQIRNGAMQVLNADNSGLLAGADKRAGVSHAAVDSRDHKWFSDGYRTYRYDGQTWTRFDSTNSPLRWVVRIVPDGAGNVWFAGGRGLVKYDGNRWTELTAQNSQLPAGLVNGVFVDRQNRMWASTYKGRICLENGRATLFNGGDTPLAHAAFNCARQDSDGTIWFGLYDPDRQGRYNGLARLSPQGQWQTFTAENSGFPGNSVDALVIDAQHVVWAGVNRVGLCRFDGQNWTLYTPENSAIPSSIVADLAQAADGTLWGATYAGLFTLRPR